jgi:hypothetical protein
MSGIVKWIFISDWCFYLDQGWHCCLLKKTGLTLTMMISYDY